MNDNLIINRHQNSPSGVRGIHPHKFTMWMALGSICMMFAGLTSAYIVKRNQGNWLEFEIPVQFWYSTFVILLSSATFYLSVNAFKERAMSRYKALITITAILGVLFVMLQWAGFGYLNHHGVQLLGRGSNPSASFLFVIIALHIVHVLGGVIALLIILFRAYNNKVKTYSTVTLEIAGTYWYFVDLLWIYLLIFFYLIK